MRGGGWEEQGALERDGSGERNDECGTARELVQRSDRINFIRRTANDSLVTKHT